MLSVFLLDDYCILRFVTGANAVRFFFCDFCILRFVTGANAVRFSVSTSSSCKEKMLSVFLLDDFCTLRFITGANAVRFVFCDFCILRCVTGANAVHFAVSTSSSCKEKMLSVFLAGRFLYLEVCNRSKCCRFFLRFLYLKVCNRSKCCPFFCLDFILLEGENAVRFFAGRFLYLEVCNRSKCCPFFLWADFCILRFVTGANAVHFSVSTSSSCVTVLFCLRAKKRHNAVNFPATNFTSIAGSFFRIKQGDSWPFVFFNYWSRFDPKN